MTSVTAELQASWLGEPLLRFADDGLHVDPRTGLARYGPRSLGTPRHRAQLRVGIIGTAEARDQAQQWLTDAARGVPGDETNPRFIGSSDGVGFQTVLAFNDSWTGIITRRELDDVITVRPQQERFELAVNLLEHKLRNLAPDQPPDYVVVIPPDELVRRCRVANYRQNGDLVHRDLRRAFKAAAMRYHLPTQMLRQQTFDGRDRTPPAKVAWNFFTGMYTKAGGYPWSPTDLEAGTCYLGIGFFRPLGEGSRMQASVVQAFDEHGEGLVLRGQDFEWDRQKMGTPSPHLGQDQAAELLDRALTRYRAERGHTPRRVVVHKTSRYWDAERAGLQEAARAHCDRLDLLALESQSTFRVLPHNGYPALRGTRVEFGRLDYLYTGGFVPALGEFHGVHVPAPIRVADHIGHDTPRQQLLREVLTLTKLNWNSARLGMTSPITLRFASLVGEILRELGTREPLPQFKFYI
jgi:hypothetical protein